MLEFLDKPHETRCVILDAKGLEATKELPSTLKKGSKSMFFLKLMNEKITAENIDSLVPPPLALRSTRPTAAAPCAPPAASLPRVHRRLIA